MVPEPQGGWPDVTNVEVWEGGMKSWKVMEGNGNLWKIWKHMENHWLKSCKNPGTSWEKHAKSMDITNFEKLTTFRSQSISLLLS